MVSYPGPTAKICRCFSWRSECPAECLMSISVLISQTYRCDIFTVFILWLQYDIFRPQYCGDDLLICVFPCLGDLLQAVDLFIIFLLWKLQIIGTHWGIRRDIFMPHLSPTEYIMNGTIEHYSIQGRSHASYNYSVGVAF